MSDIKKLDRWAEKLLDTGKRNNLINFKDTKSSTAEIIYPDAERIFSNCSISHTFEIYDPKITNNDLDDSLNENESDDAHIEERLTKEEFLNLYGPRIKNDKYLLTYSSVPNPITTIKSIAKKANEMQNETGINVAYLAFGFLRWNEKEGSEVFYRAPLLLVHVNIITGSIIDPIKIEICDDDIIVNPTFNYLLQAEYGMTLPSFDDDDNLSDYYAKVQDLVKKMGWTILDECKLGIFSFLKINMYEDLIKNKEKILESRNIQVLLGEQSEDNIGFGDAQDEITVTDPLIELHTVVDADSSQIEAIEMAKSGKSFVLQGPPGTGKSQTITNIIAESLHDGKKVLFVSEKQAALNVVYDKLKKAGLSDFCLELHSHKANKKAVIEELNRTLETPKSLVSSKADNEIRLKKDAKNKLDSYAIELHKKREVIEKSLYQLFELYSAERFNSDIQYIIPNISQKGQKYLRESIHLLEQYAEYVNSIGDDYHKNHLYGFTNVNITYEEREVLKQDLNTIFNGISELQAIINRINNQYDIKISNLCFARKYQKIFEFISKTNITTPSLLSLNRYEFARPHIDNMSTTGALIVSLENEIGNEYKLEMLDDFDGKDIFTKLSGQFSSFFSRVFNGEYKNIIAKLTVSKNNDKKIKYNEALNISEKIMNLQIANQKYVDIESNIPGALGDEYSGPSTDWKKVQEELNFLADSFDDEIQTLGYISTMDYEQYKNNKNEFELIAIQLDKQFESIKDALNRVVEQFSTNIIDFENSDLDYCVDKTRNFIGDFDKLSNWVNFLNLMKQISEHGDSEYLEVAIQNSIKSSNIVDTYKKLFYKQWIENIIFSVPSLATFSRVNQDIAVKNFADKDELQYEISKVQIRSELSNNRPNLDMVAGGSSVSLLRREGNKKRKQMPIRKLLSEITSLVQILKPCFLMSPLSVSTFLDPDKIQFDTVIFDEASQIFPQDAVGAIYRGKQLIVVGDSRQMPPSNFFNANTEIDDDDEEIGDINDFESILDVCSSVFTTERLAWHYRSHYEQLIAFSNLNFYNNHLVTFPSSTTDCKGIGVDYYNVDGVFDRKSKTNRVEAEFIVDLIYQNIDEYPQRSLGVVAFSVSQQNLIDRLLAKRREEDPSYEWFFKSDNPEPFFIKNLETVQGDERDTIIFSVAYAKDSQGRFIQNFGPLNREGGERRLNVAVTRAKDNVQLVSSIRYTDINISNTGSEGVRLLRAYLDYAQNGEDALERAITVSQEDKFDSYFEQEVCDFLRDKGYTVDTQIGCSGYKIDLGLRKPNSSNYLMAIECDGATYHSSKNARDRDILRQRVLENMGWRFYRIWSTDWYKNKVVAKEQLLKVVNEALVGNDDDFQNKNKTKIEEKVSEEFVIEKVNNRSDFDEYIQVSNIDLYTGDNKLFQIQLRGILYKEAPLSEELLLKRIVHLFNREKVTNVVLNEYNYLMYNCELNGIVRRNGFLYLKDMEPPKLRIPGDKREIKHISIEELASGLYILIKQNVTVDKDGLFKTLANILGFNRTGEGIVSRFESALRYLVDDNYVKEENGVLSISE